MLAVPTVFMLAPLSCTEPGSKTLEVSLDFVEEELSVPINLHSRQLPNELNINC